MTPTFYSILHVFSVLVMTGFTFYAFAADPSTRKRTLAFSGIASLLALIAGFGLQAKLSVGFPGWLIVKIVCWLGLSALTGIGYRRRGAAGALALVAIVLVFVAVLMVYLKPF
jgi:hypothetical protein